MEIKQRGINGIVILDFDGDLETNTALDAENYLAKLIVENVPKILLNFEKLEYISSAGLRVLLGTAKQLEAKSGVLRICSLNETVQEIFEISGFCSILNVSPTEQEALDCF